MNPPEIPQGSNVVGVGIDQPGHDELITQINHSRIRCATDFAWFDIAILHIHDEVISDYDALFDPNFFSGVSQQKACMDNFPLTAHLGADEGTENCRQQSDQGLVHAVTPYHQLKIPRLKQLSAQCSTGHPIASIMHIVRTD